MTGMNANIDHTRTKFEFPLLTKIARKPNIKALQKIKKELAASGTNVTCDLGGGAHGHLGLVLDPVEYTEVTLILQSYKCSRVHPKTNSTGNTGNIYKVFPD